MIRIASATDIENALMSILAYSRQTEQPSRRILVARLQEVTQSLMVTAAATSLEEQYKMLKSHPPKVEENDGMWAVECFSPFVRKYIPMAALDDKSKAEGELVFWEKDHKRLLKTLKEATNAED